MSNLKEHLYRITRTIGQQLKSLAFKMQFLQKNILLQFKDKLFMYSFFEFRVIYLILYGEVSLGVCV